MTIRLGQKRPALAHLPIALLPMSAAAAVVAGGMAACRVGAVGRTAGVNFVYGVNHFVQKANERKLAPTIMTNLRKQS